MGSLEEEKLFQMVQDFIESESPPHTFSPSSETTSLNHHAKYFILKGILESNTDGEIEVVESVLEHMRNKMDGEKTGVKKWLAKKLKRDGYNASLCQTSWPTTLGCPGGEYKYIEIMIEEHENGIYGKRRLILDIDFKSQFKLARQTPTYKELTDALPTIFVGDEQKLKRILSLLCSAAKQSLRERGLHFPPWRTITYMQSKWLSHSQKVCGKGNKEAPKVGALMGSSILSIWAPPLMVKPKRRNFGGGSGLSSQFSKLGAECC